MCDQGWSPNKSLTWAPRIDDFRFWFSRGFELISGDDLSGVVSQLSCDYLCKFWEGIMDSWSSFLRFLGRLFSLFVERSGAVGLLLCSLFSGTSGPVQGGLAPCDPGSRPCNQVLQSRPRANRVRCFSLAAGISCVFADWAAAPSPATTVHPAAGTWQVASSST